MAGTPRDSAAGPFLLIDEGFVGSLHTALGLARAGMSVVLLGAVGGRRRSIRRPFPALTGPRPGDPAFGAFVEATARRFACRSVVPLTEPTMEASRALRPASWPALDEGQWRILTDKPTTSAWAAGLGVAGPSAVSLREAGAVEIAADRWGWPLVAKAARGRGGDGVHILHDVESSKELVAGLLRSGVSGVVQEFVPGPTYLVGGLFARGEPLRLYAGVKVRQQPPATGPASVIRSVHEADLVDRAVRVMAALRWTGLASMDFVRDPGRGFLFLEINPRPWGSIAAASDAGVDLFGPLAALIVGESVAPRLAWRPGVTTRVLPLYLLDRRMRRDLRLPARLVADLLGGQGAPFRSPALAAHTLHRFRRVRANWPRPAASVSRARRIE